MVAVNAAGPGPASPSSDPTTTNPKFAYLANGNGNKVWKCPFGAYSTSSDCTSIADSTWATNEPFAIGFVGTSAFVGEHTCPSGGCAAGCAWDSSNGGLSSCALTVPITSGDVGGIATYGPTLFFTDIGNGNVAKCTVGAGNTLNCAESTTMAGSYRAGIFATSDTTFYMTDTSTGAYLCTYATGTSSCTLKTSPYTFNFPWGIAIIGNAAIITEQKGGVNGNIWVCDMTTTPNWTCTQQYNSASGPTGVAVFGDSVYTGDDSGNVLVSTLDENNFTFTTTTSFGSGFGYITGITLA